MISFSRSKKEEHKKINKQIKTFLTKGGTIQILDNGTETVIEQKTTKLKNK